MPVFYRLPTIVLAVILGSGVIAQCAIAAPPSRGVASWYGRAFAGRRMANGHLFRMAGLSAAHLTLPLGSWVRVTNEANGLSVDLPITDRGPHVHGRIIDLSRAAASRLGMIEAGLARVTVQRLPDGASHGCAWDHR